MCERQTNLLLISFYFWCCQCYTSENNLNPLYQQYSTLQNDSIILSKHA